MLHRSFLSILFVLSWAVASTSAFALLPDGSDNIFSLNFDWDVNLFHLDTQVVLFHRITGEELHISSLEFGQVRGDIGKTKYLDYEVRSNHYKPEESSFRFSDSSDENYFLSDLTRALANADISMFGPEYIRYYYALKQSTTRPWVTIITSRGASPQFIWDGQRHLHTSGLLPDVPELRNLYPIAYAQSPTAGWDNAKAKVFTIISILDRIQFRGISEKTASIIGHSGKEREKLHYFEFSDDSKAYIAAVKQALTEAISQGQWSNIKIALVYTGDPTDEFPAQRMVFQKNGSLRPMNSDELFEINDAIGMDPSLSFESFYESLLSLAVKI